MVKSRTIFEWSKRIYAEPMTISNKANNFHGVKLYKRQTLKKRDEQRAIAGALKKYI